MTSVPQQPPANIIPEEEERQAEGSANTRSQPLALPEPSEGEAKKLDVTGGDGQQSMNLYHLGPMVVNSDGTLSRIHNWAEMIDIEKERTLKVLTKRNRIRTEALEKK